MKLRYQMFFLVGGLFCLCFFFAVIIQDSLTKNLLEKAKVSMAEKLGETLQKEEKQVANFLSGVLADGLGKMETFLKGASGYPLFVKQFANNTDSTWSASGDLLNTNKWIDLIENQTGNTLGSGIIVDSKSLRTSHITDVALEEPWIMKITSEAGEYIGISLPLSFADSSVLLKATELTRLYFLFSKEQLLSFKDIQFDTTTTGNLAPLFEEFQTRLRFAATNTLHWKPYELPEQAAKPDATTKSYALFQSRIHDQALRNTQIVLIRVLTMFLAPNLFGTAPTGKEFPIGISMFSGEESNGMTLLAQDAFFVSSFPENVEKNPLPVALPFPPIIIQNETNDLYLANRLFFPTEDKNTSLTIGISIRNIAHFLSTSLNLPSFCVHGGNVFFASDPWKEIIEQFPLNEALEKPYGTVNVNGCELFFNHMQPLPGVDLHFFTIDLASREFELLNYFESGSKALIGHITWYMWSVAFIAFIIVALVLNRMAFKITEPISHLANAAKTLEKGRLAEVVLPKINLSRHDEVHSLYSTFDKMIVSLKDQERVRAALNKVVSPTIAAEILKSDMKLGGEKKQICVMFADIRGFTEITEKMPPEQVIDMLNRCMTKVSHIIDEHHGIIDKYVGDEVMALFGIPIPKDENIGQAIQSAIKIQMTLTEWNKERSKEGLFPILMGIGIDSGEMIAGNMGAEDRQNYTVLGSHVNMASRLCNLAKPGQILISEAVYQMPHVKEEFSVREASREHLKGFSETVPIYEVLC